MQNTIYSGLFGDAEVASFLDDGAAVSAMIRVEAALAKAQGQIGVIPENSAEAIAAAARQIEIDPSELAAGTARDGVVVPAFVAAFRAAMNGSEHAQYVHWGATSQDIIDTAFILNTRDVVNVIRTRLEQLVNRLAQLAETHQHLAMAGRTRSQIATPTTFGAKAASWGAPILRHLDRIDELKPRLEVVSFGGASGTMSAMGADALRVVELMAKDLGLGATETPWHASRDTICELGGLCVLMCGSLSKMAGDLILLGQSEVMEIRFGTGGGSSTMPHKSNPVAAETIQALATSVIAQNQALQTSAVHKHERDGSAWPVEWITLPQMLEFTAASLRHAVELTSTLQPNGVEMRATINGLRGLMFAEAATFELSKTMPRPEAQKIVKNACIAVTDGAHLRTQLEPMFPNTNWAEVFDPERNTGHAATFAQRFVTQVRHRLEKDI